MTYNVLSGMLSLYTTTTALPKTHGNLLEIRPADLLDTLDDDDLLIR